MTFNKRRLGHKLYARKLSVRVLRIEFCSFKKTDNRLCVQFFTLSINETNELKQILN